MHVYIPICNAYTSFPAACSRMGVGYVYVEAESQYAVKEALQGFRNLRVSGEIRMVPLKEMPGVFSQVGLLLGLDKTLLFT